MILKRSQGRSAQHARGWLLSKPKAIGCKVCVERNYPSQQHDGLSRHSRRLHPD